MTTNKALLLLVMGFAVGSIGVALLMRGTDVDSPRLSMEELGPRNAPPPPITTAPVELSRAPAAERKSDETRALPTMTTIAGEAKLPTEQDWAAKYAGLGAEQLRSKQHELNMKISELAMPELQRRHDAGQSELLHLGASSSSKGREWDPEVVMGLFLSGSKETGETRRVVLPESQFPELYALRREERWLEKQREAAQRNELQAKLQSLGYSKQ